MNHRRVAFLKTRSSFQFLLFALSFILLASINTSPVHADTTHCGTITTDETWSGTGNVHVVQCDVIVASGATLTISDGAIVKLQNTVDLLVDGALVVSGTAENPVYFTSYRDDSIGGDTNGDGSSYGARNDWHGIAFRDTSDDTNSSISHAIIRFSGYDFGGSTRGGAIRLLEASPTVQHTTITDSAFCAMSADLSSFPTLSDNTFEDNARNAFCLLGGTLAADATWNVTDTPYYLVNDVTVTIDNTLAIAPGVIIKLQNAVDLLIDGALVVNGTESNPVYITSYRDDSIAGDSNGDGSSYGARNDWHGIAFRDTSDDDLSVVSHAIIRYSDTILAVARAGELFGSTKPRPQSRTHPSPIAPFVR